MNKLSKVHIDSLEKHLPGRLILNLYKSLTQKYGIAPTKNQVVRLLKENEHRNPVFVYYFNSFFTNNHFIPVDFENLMIPEIINADFPKLNEFPLQEPIFLYIKNCRDLFEVDEIVSWIECSELKESSDGYFYTVILTKEGGPKEIICLINIRTSQTHPDPVFTFQGKRGIETKGIEEVFENPLLAFCISLLNYIANNPVGKFINDDEQINQLQSNTSLNYPLDNRLVEKIKLLKEGRERCIKAKVHLSDILPFNYDFCLDFPERYILGAQRYLSEILEDGILTYEFDGKLIMSDNYAYYLALRKNKIKEITVVNIGNISLRHEIIEEGGEKLLPPVQTYPGSISTLSHELKEELLSQKLEKLDLLHKIERIKSQNYQEIKEQILNNRLNQSLNELILISIDNFKQDELILVKYRLAKLTSDIKKGILSYEQENIEFNRIRNGIIEIINEM